MGNILVLGGNQFLGVNICKELLIEKYQVYVLNRGTRKNLQEVTHLKGDRNNKIELNKITKNIKFEAVIDISAYEEHQIKKSLDALEGRYKKYILISSASIYQNISERPAKESDCVGENIVWGDYAKNKFLCEEMLKSKTKNYVVFRPFYLYGPGNNLDRENYFFNRILAEQPIYLPSKQVKIQFGFVEDLSKIVVKAISDSNFIGESFNVSGEEILTFKEMIEIMGEVLNKKVKYKFVNTLEEKVNARDWFPFREVNLYGDLSKINKVTKGSEMTPFKVGLKKTLDYCKKSNILGNYNIEPLEEKFINRHLGSHKNDV